MSDRSKLGLVVASAAVLGWWSPVAVVVVALSAALGWALRDSGSRGMVAFVVLHLLGFAMVRRLDVTVVGLGALGLQQLVWATSDRRSASLLDYLLTLTFAPRAFGGPVWTGFQRRSAKPDPTGWRLVALGLFEKVVIADGFAWWADAVFDSHGPVAFLDAWTGIVAFAVQALFDLAGLWHIALGLGRVVGLELPTGPSAPFRAPTPAAFWKRWHPSVWETLSGVGTRLRAAGAGRLGLATALGLGIAWHATSPTLAAAAALQVLWIGLGAALAVRVPRLVRLATPLLALHGLMLARSPTFERAAFVQDGAFGVFGVGSADMRTLLVLLIGVMVLFLGPPDPARVFSPRVTRHPIAGVGLGLAAAAILVCLVQARAFLYPSF